MYQITINFQKEKPIKTESAFFYVTALIKKNRKIVFHAKVEVQENLFDDVEGLITFVKEKFEKK